MGHFIDLEVLEALFSSAVAADLSKGCDSKVILNWSMCSEGLIRSHLFLIQQPLGPSLKSTLSDG